MNNLLQLIIRVLMFSLTFYLLIEYIVVCDVQTQMGVAIVTFAISFIILFFIFFSKNKFKECNHCGHRRSLFFK